MGCTLDVPTFKIPHATGNWRGTRIIAVMFTTPIKRIDACKQNLRGQLQQLGFVVPDQGNHWDDSELTGMRFGRPIYCKSASIRGLLVREGDCEHGATDKIEYVHGVDEDSMVWEICSSCSETGVGIEEITHTWPDIFGDDISEIECCSEGVADTEIDTSTESPEQPSKNSSHETLENKVHGTNLRRKRKRHSPVRSSNEVIGECMPRSLGFSADALEGRFGRSSSSGHNSEGFKSYTSQGSSVVFDGCYDRSGFDSDEIFGFNNSRSLIWAVSADPVETFSDDDRGHVLTGGVESDATFQPNKADISKLVQKLKAVQHGFAPKQIHMLLISDLKFCKKIERTKDAKQLQSCVVAAAQRMGLTNSHDSSALNAAYSNRASSSQQRKEKTMLSLLLPKENLVKAKAI